jgi:cell wall-associated NlpC family hydrolase
MPRSAVARVTLGIVLLLPVALPLCAQDVAPPPWTFEAFAARKKPSGSSLFGGIGLSKFWGVVGLRLGGSVNLQNSDTGTTNSQGQNVITLGGWTADADLILEPLRGAPSLRWAFLGFSPYIFVGAGGGGLKVHGAPDSSTGTWSAGAGLHHALIGPLGIVGEARYRRPFSVDSMFNKAFSQNTQYRLGITLSFGSHGHKEATPAPTPAPAPPVAARVVPPPAPARTDESVARFASRLLDEAESYLGTPYRYGGTSPYGGFDAGGFVQYVFGRMGVRLPRTARQMAELGEVVPLKPGSLQPGDLVFFASQGKAIDHVAIYAGQDRVIHSTSSGGGVRYDAFGEGDRGRWFSDHLVAARRAPAPAATPADELLDPPDLAPAPTGAPR